MTAPALPTQRTITANDVARAEEEVRRSKAAWDRYGCRTVTDAEIAEAQVRVSQGVKEARQFQSLAWRRVQATYGFYWLIEKTGVATWGWLVGGMMAGAAMALPAALLVLLASPRLSTFFISFGLCFFVAGSAMAATLYVLSRRSVAQEIHNLRAQLNARQAQMATVQERLFGWRSHLARLREARSLHEQHERAVRHYTQLVDLLRNRRYQLIHSDWRSLRGIPFEHFIAEAFEELGFVVETTKASGDQGVDLIVRGKGRNIAVQTKGYGGSVGNKAVQEVYAGMAFYNCQECLVVTNSYFTPGAITLAQSVGCRLIDGQQIPPLIEGRLY